MAAADALYGWMKNLAIFFLFMTAVLNVLPDENYRKYIRFFLGIVMILVFTQPLLALADLDETLEVIYRNFALEEEVNAMENAQIKVEGLQKEYVYQACAREMEEQIRVYLANGQIPDAQVEVEMDIRNPDRLLVKKIRITVQRKEDGIYYEDETEWRREMEERLLDMKKELSEVYQIDMLHIIVEIQE